VEEGVVTHRLNRLGALSGLGGCSPIPGLCGDDVSFLGALCPSKSGLMNTHIVKHIVLAFGYRDLTVFWVSQG